MVVPIMVMTTMTGCITDMNHFCHHAGFLKEK